MHSKSPWAIGSTQWHNMAKWFDSWVVNSFNMWTLRVANLVPCGFQLYKAHCFVPVSLVCLLLKQSVEGKGSTYPAQAYCFSPQYQQPYIQAYAMKEMLPVTKNQQYKFIYFFVYEFEYNDQQCTELKTFLFFFPLFSKI